MVSEEDVATIARDHMIKWEPLRPYLGLNRQQEEVICHAGNYWKQKLDCLEEWKVLKGDRATYGALITAAEKARDQQLADRVKALLSRTYVHMVLWEGRIARTFSIDDMQLATCTRFYEAHIKY